MPSEGSVEKGTDVRTTPPPRAITFEAAIEYLLTEGDLPKTEAERKAFMENLGTEIDEIVYSALVEKFGRRIVTGVGCGSLTW